MSYRDDPQWLVALINRDGPNCWYCGVKIARSEDMIYCEQSDGWLVPENMGSPTRDHMVPKCRKGSNRKHNLVLCCSRCNSDKGRLNVEEYRQKVTSRERSRVVFHGERA